jgi:hypothetical protein
MRDEPGPFAAAAADADVEILARKIGQQVGGVEPDCDLRMRELKCAEMRDQPVGGERAEGGDREDALRRILKALEGGAELREGFGNRPGEASSGVG